MTLFGSFFWIYEEPLGHIYSLDILLILGLLKPGINSIKAPLTFYDNGFNIQIKKINQILGLF